MRIAEIIYLALAVAGVVYQFFSVYSLRKIMNDARARKSGEDYKPRVSVLKPVCGIDRDSRRSLMTFLSQDYDDYEVLFGVLARDDPAAVELESIVTADDRAKLHIGSDIEGANNKVRILHTLAANSTGEILIIADADTRAAGDFISRIVAPFADPGVGVVTCFYRGVEAIGLGDGLHALQMSTVFAPSAAAAGILNGTRGIDFGMGAVLAVRGSVLREIGGFEAIADYLADDYYLGNLAARAGYRVVIPDYVADIVLNDGGIEEVYAREVRWSRTVRVCRPWGYLGYGVSHTLLWALLYAFYANFSVRGLLVLAIAAAVRMFSAAYSAALLDDREFGHNSYLLPLRDAMSVVVWAAGFTSNTVVWRGRKLKIRRDGRSAEVRQRLE